MSKLTKDQQFAVDASNTNIIVSAGAGSGKTTVLKERVLRILKSGVKINQLIILTFTNNAASEMKERIRNIILDNKDVIDNLELIDSAYITTFDSFAATLVKKYNYLLNIDKDFSIIDESLVNNEIKRIIDEIFEEYYASNNEFKKLIASFEVKNDNRVKEGIISLYKGLSNVLNRSDFLNTYLDKYYSDNYINETFEKLEDHVFSLINDIKDIYDDFKDTMLDVDTIKRNDEIISGLLNSTTFDEVRDNLSISFVRKGKNNYSDDYIIYKDKIKELINDIKDIVETYSKNELINNYKSTKDNVSIIIDILKILDERLNEFKTTHNSYEFSDIAFKAIELVKTYPDVANEIKNSTYEIMIDEYQDTNDIQETFISYISNNNVYTVGDVKQSIYRFRNANPYIFKSRYDLYKSTDKGIKIDLNMNFRSRREVIDAINLIFSNCMTDEIGGANYKVEHKMIAGNESFNDYKLFDYNLEILDYENEDINDDEVEAFIIADDILKRINKKDYITYFEDGVRKSREISYKDFAILVDKGKNFELLKKVLEYKNIPALIDKDLSVKEDDEIYILKNLINLIINLKQKKYDNDFKHAWISVARSYVVRLSDDEIFNVFKNNSFLDTNVINKLNKVILEVDSVGITKLLELLIKEFNITDKLIIDGNIIDKLTKLELFISKSKSLNDFGYDLYKVNEYFDELLNGNNDILMKSFSDDANSVKIMTIHASKGLEYPIVYVPYLNSDFTKSNDHPLFSFSQNTGIMIPFACVDGYDNTFTYKLDNIIEYQETLSEKIRLFYVALTRAEEKLILVNKKSMNINPVNELSYSELLSVKRLSDIINKLRNNLSKYFIPVDISKLNISKDYNKTSLININDIRVANKVINVKKLNINTNTLDNLHFSKALTKVIDKSFKERLDYGTHMHYLFEVFDFKNGNTNELNISNDERCRLENFLKHDEVKNIKDATIYKEKEIMFLKDGAIYHGFIDLLLEYSDHADIIDYKLSNIDSPEYKKQLSGYKEYIESTFNKPVNIYLYSINKDIFKKL